MKEQMKNGEHTYRAFLPVYRRKVKDLIITKGNKIVLNKILLWLQSCDLNDTEKDKFDNTKGLYLFGDFGTGKSLLVSTLRQFCFYYSTKYYNIPLISSQLNYKLMHEKAKNNCKVLPYFQKNENLIVDDFDYNNESKINNWGNTTNMAASIIYIRHLIWKSDHRIKTIFTSNLSPQKMKQKHGEGIYSRLVEMCNLALWDGENLRLRNKEIIH